MAFIRIVRPGEPVRPELFEDLGQCRARIPSKVSGSFGGPIIAAPAKKVHVGRHEPHLGGNQAPEPVRKPPPEIVRCGMWMPTAGESCYRRIRHKQACMTRAAVERDSARRRASYRERFGR